MRQSQEETRKVSTNWFKTCRACVERAKRVKDVPDVYERVNQRKRDVKKKQEKAKGTVKQKENTEEQRRENVKGFIIRNIVTFLPYPNPHLRVAKNSDAYGGVKTESVRLIGRCNTRETTFERVV